MNLSRLILLRPPRFAAARRAFTLIELLVVISILGLLAGLAVPAIKNLGKSNMSLGAGRQMLDDVGRARQYAMSQRTTVYMIFVPTNFWDTTVYWPTGIRPTTPDFTNLADKQLTGYIFVTLHSVGDQPGRGSTNFLSGWQALPDHNFIPSWKFLPRSNVTNITDIANPATVLYSIPGFDRTTVPIPFPSTNSGLSAINLPYIAFNYQGQLTSQVDEYIPLAVGTVAPGMDGNKNLQLTTPLITEIPPNNSVSASYHVIHINWLTGRAREESQQVK